MSKQWRIAISSRIFLLVALFLLTIFLSTLQASSQSGQSTPTLQSTILLSSYGSEMVYIPSGTFMMGATDEQILETCRIFEATDLDHCLNSVRRDYYVQEAHEVEVSAFWIDRYEVTNAAYNECVAFGNCSEISPIYGPDTTFTEPDKPIIGVTWHEAMLFCNIYQARLPTEAEWEYAARGSQNRLFAWGNFYEDGFFPQDTAHDIGSNPIDISWSGAYDLSGNIGEWVEDRPLASSLPPEILPEDFYGFDTVRIIKGGSWAKSVLSAATYTREYVRAYVPNDAGFRCVRTTSPSS